MNYLNDTVTFLMVGLISMSCSSSDKIQRDVTKSVSVRTIEINKDSVTKVTTNWPARPKLAIQEMMAKYGKPSEISAQTVVWHNAGFFKRITVTKMEIPHDFPKPHMDFLEHTVFYNVPTDKIDDLIAFDTSITINKTAGEMSARCDLERHNILALNLARDIIEGRRNVTDARQMFGQYMVEGIQGKNPTYLAHLNFQPQAMEEAVFLDRPTIPGSPMRVNPGIDEMGTDSEVMAFVIATDENEVLAAAEAQKKDISPPVMDYAKMLQFEHGKNAALTMKLSQKISMRPKETKAVDNVRINGAQKLATLVALDGKKFEKAYLNAMVAGHKELLIMIDQQLMKDAENESLKMHLNETRKHVVSHLLRAQNLQKII